MRQLYYSSLESHNRAFRKELNQQSFNDVYTKELNDIARESERLLLPRAETELKIAALKEKLKAAVMPNKNTKDLNTLASAINNTNTKDKKNKPSPIVPNNNLIDLTGNDKGVNYDIGFKPLVPIEEKYVSYNEKMNKANPYNDKVVKDVLDQFKDKDVSKVYKNVIDEIKAKALKKAENVNDYNKAIQKNLDEIAASGVSNKFIDELQKAINNEGYLKKTPKREVKTKPKSPLAAELEQKYLSKQKKKPQLQVDIIDEFKRPSNSPSSNTSSPIYTASEAPTISTSTTALPATSNEQDLEGLDTYDKLDKKLAGAMSKIIREAFNKGRFSYKTYKIPNRGNIRESAISGFIKYYENTAPIYLDKEEKAAFNKAKLALMGKYSPT